MFMSVQRSVRVGPAAGSGPREVTDQIFLPRPVRQVFSALSGYSASFPGSGNGRPLGQLVASVDPAEFTGHEVHVRCRFGMRDWSGDWDDAYEGLIDYIVVAELEDDDASGPDISINGVEWSQSIQFFRAHLDLDVITRRPDNAIPLVAGKATAIRVYAGYAPPGGEEPGFKEYEGELTVVSSGGSEVLGLDPGAFPARDTLDDPLPKTKAPRFIVPAELCRGEVTIRGRLRSVNIDTGTISPWSVTFERRLTFQSGAGLTVFVVGLRVVGDRSPARAPDREEAESMLNFARSMYPFDEIRVSGFLVKDMELTTSDAIRDLLLLVKGDSEAVHLGLFSAEFAGSIAGNEGERIGGEAFTQNGEGVAWSVADAQTVAHELGHLLGRRHVDTGHDEGDPHEQLPSYGAYPPGSIGQHGIDTLTGVNYEPAVDRDIMSYAARQWISAAAYSSQLGWRDPGPGVHLERQRSDSLSETLFLSLTISRDRRVRLHTSFHFPARRSPEPRGSADFVLEITDDCRNVLVCWPLTRGAAASYCWPKSYFAKAPYPAGAKWLLIWEGDKLIHEECIPAAPALSLTGALEASGIRLTWATNARQDLSYLVQWKDAGGSWRGLPPVTRRTTALAPAGLFRGAAHLRVLASSGIATGVATLSLLVPRRPNRVTIGLNTILTSGRAPVRAAAWRAFAYDELGRTVSPDFVWFSGAGRRIRAGAILRASELGPEVTEVAIALRDRHDGNGPARRAWRVVNSGSGRTLTPSSECYPHSPVTIGLGER